MNRKIVSYGITLLLLATPMLAMADSIPGEPTLAMLLSRMAFLKAEQQGIPIACAIATSKQTVRLGEAFTVAWGSYGAYELGVAGQSRWAQNGTETIVVNNTPGIYEYKFSFAGPGGVATCINLVTVLAR